MPDARLKTLIEQSAVDDVWATLESGGWTVTDVQKDNLGWDLTARSGRTVRRVEVKGRAAGTPLIHLTHNEIRAAEVENRWWLAVVTRALNDAPELSWFAARDGTLPMGPRSDRWRGLVPCPCP